MENDYYRVIPSHAMPLANGSFDCTSHEGFFSATTQPKELVSVGVQTDPMRKKQWFGNLHDTKKIKRK